MGRHECQLDYEKCWKRQPIAFGEEWARLHDFPELEESEMSKPKERYLSDFAITIIAIVAFAVIVPTCLYLVAV